MRKCGKSEKNNYFSNETIFKAKIRVQNNYREDFVFFGDAKYLLELIRRKHDLSDLRKTGKTC